MNDRGTVMSEAFSPLLPRLRSHRPAVEPVSQINLRLHGSGEDTAFERARNEIIKYAKRRAGGTLPRKALEGKSFSPDDQIGPRRVEGVALDSPRRWALRFDDEDREVAGRSWVIETALAEQDNDKPVLFGLRLQCITRGEDKPYDRTIPTFARDVIATCEARLDNHRVTLTPRLVDTAGEVDRLVNLLTSHDRAADVVVVSLPEQSKDPANELISSKELSHSLAGAAHVVLLSGPGAFHLSDRVGREFSVFQQAVRTYRPGFDPDTEAPFAHPLGLADRIRNWNGGPDAYRRFIISKVLRQTVERTDTQQRLPSFARIKQVEAEHLRHEAKQRGSSADELLILAEKEIKQLEENLKSQKKEDEELLGIAEDERDEAKEKAQRLQSTLYHAQQRIQSLEVAKAEPAATVIPDNLDELEEWAKKYLAGSVELHNRALRGAKNSEYEDVPVIYEALLLLRDHYVPMRREGGKQLKQAFNQKCQKLGIEDQQTFSGNLAGEQGDTYFIKIGQRRLALDRHLKKGSSRDPRYCFRLYFFWDDPTNQVVVGWLPSHLVTRAS